MSGLEGVILALKSVGLMHTVHTEREWTTVRVPDFPGGTLIFSVDLSGTVVTTQTKLRRFRRPRFEHSETDVVSLEWRVWTCQTADSGVR